MGPCEDCNAIVSGWRPPFSTSPVIFLLLTATLGRLPVWSPVSPAKPTAAPKAEEYWATAVLQWKGLPYDSAWAERNRLGEAHAAGVRSQAVLAAAIRRPGVGSLGLVRRQADPVRWLSNNLQVLVLPSVTYMSDFGPAAEFPATATVAVGLAAPQSTGALVPALLVSDWRRFLQPEGALTLWIWLGAGMISAERADLLNSPSDQVHLVNAIAEAYQEYVARDEPQRAKTASTPFRYSRRICRALLPFKSAQAFGPS